MMDQLGLSTADIDLSKAAYGVQETYTVHKAMPCSPASTWPRRSPT